MLASEKNKIQVKVQRERAWAPRVKLNLDPILVDSARIELAVEFALRYVCLVTSMVAVWIPAKISSRLARARLARSIAACITNANLEGNSYGQA